MKIEIKRKKANSNSKIVKFRSFTIRVPLWILKFKFVWKSYLKENTNVDFDELKDKVYKSIKDYVKENGHFVLLDIESKEGNVLIKV